MEHSFPKWLSYAVLGFVVLLVGFGIYGIEATPTTSSSEIGDAFFGVVWVCLLALLMSAYLYVSRYAVQIGKADLTIRGAFRTKAISLSSIAQVITVSTPRGGTDSLLFDKDDIRLAKLDGGLLGFDALLVDLGENLRPYQAVLYRRGNWGSWEMQKAGDSHWTPSGAPRVARKEDRRMLLVLLVGCLLIAILSAFASWLNHGGFDKFL